MYCVFNATTIYNADTGNPLGWPLESNYGYFCDQRDKGKFKRAHRGALPSDWGEKSASGD